jgi:hypothetical protein
MDKKRETIAGHSLGQIQISVWETSFSKVSIVYREEVLKKDITSE